MVGVWIAPVTAQVMMTLLDVAMAGFYLGSNFVRLPLVGARTDSCRRKRISNGSLAAQRIVRDG
jgi:hypothetical protein